MANPLLGMKRLLARCYLLLFGTATAASRPQYRVDLAQLYPFWRTRQICFEVLRLKFRQFERNEPRMLQGAVVRGRRNPLHLKLPQRLKKSRKTRGLSPFALSQRAGLANSVVGYIEEDSRIPRISTVAQLAGVLGVSPGWLAYGMRPSTLIGGADGHLGLAVRLKALRTKLNLSRAELADAAGVTTGPIQNIELGLGAPGVDTVERLAIALDVSPAWLAFGEGDAAARRLRPSSDAVLRSQG
jgi:transcriptional regulator with XRE-family HTH domain